MQDAKIKDLLDKMTLEERAGQLLMLDNSFFQDGAFVTGPQEALGLTDDDLCNLGAVYNVIGADAVRTRQEDHLRTNRLGIPLLFCADIIYGHKTALPIPLGFACSWDLELIERCFEMVADEASAAGVHAVFSPMLDLSRDPRWGRVVEGCGEDPHLFSQIARAEVRGLQGDLGIDRVAACIKHFAAYGAAESGREYNLVDMSERRLRQEYLRTYQAAVEEGARMVMPSFNTINGIPATANRWLLRDVLEGEWGFDGVRVSDYAAIRELVDHGFAEDDADAAARALSCGLDFDMKTNVYAHNLVRLVREGKVDEALVNESVLRILRLKNELGLFEDPYRGASSVRETLHLHSPQNAHLARRLAEESLVLLKNEGGLLPLAPSVRVALIGPMAQSRSLCGMWAFNVDAAKIRTLEEEMADRAEGTLVCTKGAAEVDDYEFLGSMAKYFGMQAGDADPETERTPALEAAAASDVIVYAMGEHMLQSGEAASRTDLSLSQGQLSLLHDLRTLGKPLVVVCYSGRPLLLQEVADNCDALLQVYWPGSEGSAAVADVLYGKVNPSGKLTMSIPRNMGQIPVYYGQLSTGRPLVGSGHEGKFVSKYLDCENTPLYPFGYGLSYSKFDLSDLALSTSELCQGDIMKVYARISNTSDVAGMTTVQLYIRDVAGSVARPVKELVDFCRVHVEAYGEAVVSFDLREEQLRAYDADMHHVTEPGKFEVFVGLDSGDCLGSSFEYAG